MNKQQKTRTIMFLVYFALIILAVFSAGRMNDVSLLDQTNAYYISNEEFEPNLEMELIQREEQGVQKYVTQFSGEPFDELTSDTFVIFLNKLTDNAYKVKLNGMIIGSEGDLEAGHSTLKGSPNYFTFDRDLIQADNELEIFTHATYKTGVESPGVYITDYEAGMRHANKVDLFGIDLIILGLGVLFLSVISMFVFYLLSQDKDLGFLYNALGTMFMMVFFLDFLKIVYLPYSYLTFKKIFLISLHVAFWFYMLALNQYIKTSFLKYSAAISAITFIIMSLLVDNFVQYKQLYMIWYVVLLVNITIGFIYSAYNIRRVRQAFNYATTFMYAAVYAGLGIGLEYFGFAFSRNSPLVYIVIFSSIPVLIVVEEFINKENVISYERDKRENEYINSMTDNMTGVWNQRYLYKTLAEPADDMVVVMIDIDDFKTINDTHGHPTGDFVLIEFSKLINESIRQTDDVIRYGGDEFIIFFYDTSIENVVRIMEDIRSKIEQHDFIDEEQVINFTVSIGVYQVQANEYSDEILEKVDLKLYEAKQKGKNRIAV